jgi:hypothetical protein
VTTDANEAIAAASTPSSALFFDPFAAQRTREKNLKKTVEVIWTVNHLHSILVTFSNSLGTIVRYDSVLVLLEGCEHTAYSNPVELPPYCSNFVLQLLIRPLQSGKLKVIGLQFFLNNATQSIYLDENGLFNNKRYLKKMCNGLYF